MRSVVNHRKRNGDNGDTATGISEYSQRISQAIDEALSRVTELGNQEASQIIAEAQQQAQQITDQIAKEALTKAEQESAKYAAELMQKAEEKAAALEQGTRTQAEAESAVIIARAFDEAEQILAKARQAAQQEAGKTLADSRKEAEHIIAGAVGRGVEAANEVTSKVLKEFEECARAFDEAKQRLEQAVKAAAERAGEQPQHLSEAATPPDFAEAKMEVDKPMVQVEASLATVEAGNTQPYQGEVELEVKSSGDFGQMGRFTELLRKVPNIELESLSDFVQGSARATITVVEPLPLISIIKEMPLVEEVVEQGNIIKIDLKR